MYINKGNVMFFENLKEDGCRLSANIRRMVKTTTAGTSTG